MKDFDGEQDVDPQDADAIVAQMIAEKEGNTYDEMVSYQSMQDKEHMESFFLEVDTTAG